MTAPELSARERETLARIESTPAAPESFDATAALRRVLELAEADLGTPHECTPLIAPIEIRDAIIGAAS